MLKRNRVIRFIMLTVCCLLMAGCKNSEKNSYPELSEGDAAPDFTVELNNGNEFTLSEHEGEVILLNFWATWCSPCVEEMPAFDRLYEEYGDKLQVLAVNSVENKETVDRFVSEKNYKFPFGYDEKAEVNKMYPSEGIPYTVIIGRDGKVKKTFLGADEADVQYKEYRRALSEVFEE